VGSFREDFSTKHGRELRLLADGAMPSSTCTQDSLGQDVSAGSVNTGTIKRYTTPIKVQVTYYEGVSKRTLEATTKDGIAYFSFRSPNTLRIWLVLEGRSEKLLSPTAGFIGFQRVNWKQDDVWSVHALIGQ
jgi:hypothetical protein